MLYAIFASSLCRAAFDTVTELDFICLVSPNTGGLGEELLLLEELKPPQLLTWFVVVFGGFFVQSRHWSRRLSLYSGRTGRDLSARRSSATGSSTAPGYGSAQPGEGHTQLG